MRDWVRTTHGIIAGALALGAWTPSFPARAQGGDQAPYGSPVTDPPLAMDAEAPAAAKPGTAANTASYQARFSTFAGVRSEVLGLIGGAKDRVWIMSHYVTDGEVVTALFLAKYRKVDVRVVLDRRNMHSYMSRLDYLKRQNIPVYVKPDRFPAKAPTVIVADDAGYQLDANLDFMTTASSFTLRGADAAETARWADAIKTTTESGQVAIPRPMIQAGKANTGRPYYRPNPTSPVPAAAAGDGAYNYDRNRAKSQGVPEGVSRVLPKTTVYQERQKRAVDKAVREKEAAGPSAAPAPDKGPRSDDAPTRPPGGDVNANPPTSPSPSPEEP